MQKAARARAQVVLCIGNCEGWKWFFAFAVSLPAGTALRKLIKMTHIRPNSFAKKKKYDDVQMAELYTN
jgi:hypothetical protein